jgi:hypothetical protein
MNDALPIVTAQDLFESAFGGRILVGGLLGAVVAYDRDREPVGQLTAPELMRWYDLQRQWAKVETEDHVSTFELRYFEAEAADVRRDVPAWWSRLLARVRGSQRTKERKPRGL